MNCPPPRRVAAIHDLSGFGRCALTVVIPTLAVMGIQPVPMPTALLSTHTGGYSGFTFLDLTSEMKKIARHWKETDIHFDAVYSGFLGSGEQCVVVSDFIRCFRRDETIVLIDPVMGDDGELYSTVTAEITEGMRDLVRVADIITPNVTEANILLAKDNPGSKDSHILDRTEVASCLMELCSLGPREVVITGIRMGKDIVSACCEKGGVPVFCAHPRIELSYPGTGDLFASVLLGRRLMGNSLAISCEEASGFVYDVIRRSSCSGQPVREGILLENFLYKLIQHKGEQ